MPKLRGQSNWIAFRDAMVHELKSKQTGTEFSLHQLISDLPRHAIRPTAVMLEKDEFLNFDGEEVFTAKAVHFGSHFKADNTKLWALIEGLLINTYPYNYLQNCLHV